jgi:hypothetical protein
MLSIIITPPLATEERKPANIPAEKVRILNKLSLNMGYFTHLSTKGNAMSSAIPDIKPTIT